MSDATTLPRQHTADDQEARRTIRPRRSLPGGRAVIGAFLVVVAAVGTFGAYLSATAAPDTSYMVATRTFEIGDVIGEDDLVGPGAGFRGVPINLPDEQAARALTSDAGDAEQLLGQVVVAPIEAGDLVQRTQFVDAADAGDGVAMSLSLPVDRALAGQVGAGERVDVIATYARAGADGSETRLVARDVTVVTVLAGGEGLNGGRVTLTVELPDLATAQRLQHAVDTAQVAILRGGDAEAAAPEPTTSEAAPTGGAPAAGPEDAGQEDAEQENDEAASNQSATPGATGGPATSEDAAEAESQEQG